MSKENSITLKEYESIDRDEKILTNQYSRELLVFLKNLGMKEALSISVTTVTASQYVGLISFNGKKIEILPKLLGKKEQSTDDVSEPDREKMMRSLLSMLSYTHRLKISPNEISMFDFKRDHLLDVFIYQFSVDLYNGLIREAPFRYERISSNLGYIRGKVKFKENIKSNSINKSKMFCEYTNFQRDNIINQTFLYVSKLLIHITRSHETKKKLNSIIKILEGVEFKSVTYDGIKSKGVGRSYQYLEQSFNFCKMFLKSNSPTLLSGQQNNFCILFNMNEVFEEFIFEFLDRNKEKIDSDIKDIEFQRGRKLFSGWENLDTALCKVEDRRNIQNDIRINFKNRAPLIIDTKYKILTDPFKVSTADSFQMFMYSHLEREDQMIQSRIMLLYPESSKRIHYKFPYKGNETILEVHTIPLDLDTVLNEDRFCENLKNILMLK